MVNWALLISALHHFIYKSISKFIRNIIFPSSSLNMIVQVHIGKYGTQLENWKIGKLKHVKTSSFALKFQWFRRTSVQFYYPKKLTHFASFQKIFTKTSKTECLQMGFIVTSIQCDNAECVCIYTKAFTNLCPPFAFRHPVKWAFK